MSKSEKTTDHKAIEQWAKEHHGKPVKVKSTGSKSGEGIIRIAFLGNKESENKNLEEITWEEFFEIFEDQKLALVYEPHADKKTQFNKLVSRDS